MQQYIKDCATDPGVNIKSDHRLVMAKLSTPTTKKARKQTRTKKIVKQRPDQNSLKDGEIKQAFVDHISQELPKQKSNQVSVISSSIIDCLNTAAKGVLPKNNHTNEMWKND